MPPPSKTDHLPPSHPAQRQRPKSPNRVLAEAEAQWLFTEAELSNTPSIQDGMTIAEERDARAKGVNFIVQVGIMLKLPQLTLSTAAIFFQRFMMRASLRQPRGDIPKLHHYQIAATALFLATKVEESCRKMKEMVLAFCRVAQKNPNLIIDEQSKDFWRWRDCVLYHEDVLLETLCFDLTVESPHRQLFEMLKFYNLEHNRRLRNAAWAFVTDSANTPLCLLCSSRTIAVAGVYAACRFCDVQLPDDAKGRPWWETQHVRLKEVRKAVDYMVANYEGASGRSNGVNGTSAEGERSIYVGLASPIDGMDGAGHDWGERTRLRHEDQGSQGASPFLPPPEGQSERRASNASSIGVKREREEDIVVANGDGNGAANGVKAEAQENKRPRLDERQPTKESRDFDGDHDIKLREENLRVERGQRESEADVKATEAVHPSQTNGAALKVDPESLIEDKKMEEGAVERGNGRVASDAKGKPSDTISMPAASSSKTMPAQEVQPGGGAPLATDAAAEDGEVSEEGEVEE